MGPPTGAPCSKRLLDILGDSKKSCSQGGLNNRVQGGSVQSFMVLKGLKGSTLKFKVRAVRVPFREVPKQWTLEVFKC